MDNAINLSPPSGVSLRSAAERDIAELVEQARWDRQRGGAQGGTLARRAVDRRSAAAGLATLRQRNLRLATWLGIPFALALCFADLAWGLILAPLALAAYSGLLLLNPVLPIGLILMASKESGLPLPASAKKLWARRAAALVALALVLPGAFYYLTPWRLAAPSLSHAQAREASIERVRSAFGARQGLRPAPFLESRVWSRDTFEGAYGVLFGGVSRLLYGPEPSEVLIPGASQPTRASRGRSSGSGRLNLPRLSLSHEPPNRVGNRSVSPLANG